MSVTILDGRFIGVGSVEGQAESVGASDDGLTWHALAVRPFDGDVPWSIRSSSDRLVVLASRPLGNGARTVVWSSPDGRTWEALVEPAGSRHPRSLILFQDRWLMQSVFDAGIDVSTDGRVWDRAVSVEASEAAGFALGPGGVVAGYTLDSPTSFQAAVFYSADGDTWSEALLDDGGIAILDRVAADASTYVALGRARVAASPFTGAAWWSGDGTSWERAAVPGSFEAAEWFSKEVVSIGGSFVALVQLGVEGQVGVLRSTDGRAWTFVEPMPQMSLNETSLIVDDDRLLVYGTDVDDVATGVVWEGSISP